MAPDAGTLVDGACHAPVAPVPSAAALQEAAYAPKLENGRSSSPCDEEEEGDASSAQRPGGLAFFSWACTRSLGSTVLLYCGALALATLLAHGQKHLGLIVLSLLPAVFSMGYMQRLFPKCVLRSEMLLTFFWTMVWMSPLVVLENISYFGVLTRSTLEAQGAHGHSTAAIAWGYKLLSAFVRAYVLAAFFEELSKYLALRRLRVVRHVTDPRALVTYGLCAGAAFGTVEDLFIYAFSYGVENTLARACLSVPLHCMTGLLMGLSLAQDRFVHPGSRPWYKVLALPVFLHGTFDAVNFLLDGVRGEVALATEILLVLGGFVLARRRLLALCRLHPEEHDLVGLVARAAAGDKLAAFEASALHDEEEAGPLGPLGPLSRVASVGGGAGGGSGSGSDGYATDLDWSSSTFASSAAGDQEAYAEAGAEPEPDLEAGNGPGPAREVLAASRGKQEEEPAVPVAEAEAAEDACEPPLVGPSRKAIALTGLLGCSLTAGMLCFLYLVRLS